MLVLISIFSNNQLVYAEKIHVIAPPKHSTALDPMAAFQEGIVYASWWHGDYSSPESDTTLSKAIKPTGANWISIVVTCYQDTVYSTNITCKPDTLTPTDDDLRHVIKKAHELGLRVMLKPHIDIDESAHAWRGEISPDNEAGWQDWFKSYTTFITHYAGLAQSAGVDYLVVGTELAKTVHRSDDWRGIIKDVRAIYHGPLTYAAHHMSGEAAIDWWDALDAIGIDAYYPLSLGNNPTVAQIKTAWMPVVARLGQLSEKWKRPIIFTEVGYESINGTNGTPWKALNNEVDFKEQADCYQGVFEAFSGQKWWHGVFWWVWTTHDAKTSPLNNGFNGYNKPAGRVIRQHYGGQLRPLAPMPPPASHPTNYSVIYQDALGPKWEDWSWDSDVGLSTSKLKQQENIELRLSMSSWGALSLHHPGFDTSPYEWLEFYIYVGKETKSHITVSFSDASDHEFMQKIDLPEARLMDGKKFLVNQWQRVIIPLAKMGAENTTITRLTIKNNSKNTAMIFIDEISLTGNILFGKTSFK